MLDIKKIVEDKAFYQKAFQRCKISVNLEELCQTYQDYKTIKVQYDTLKHQSKDIEAHLKQNSNPEEVEALRQRLKDIKITLKLHEKKEKELHNTWHTYVATLPNIPCESTPCTQTLYKTWGPQEKKHKPYTELMEHLGQSPFDISGQISGSRWPFLTHDLARLERCLMFWMMDMHREKGYKEASVPFVVNTSAVYGVGQLPKFEDDLFQTTDGRWLISTGEVPLTAMIKNCTYTRQDLPQRWVTMSPCFRQEAGSAGQETKGLMRVHQFWKVELVHFCDAAHWQDEHAFLLEAACDILKHLELPYRVVELDAADLGFSAKKTYDIEAWLGGSQKFCEVSSVSYCGDFQGRRLQGKIHDKTCKEYVHTLNGSGLAVGRTLLAILEHYQNSDGSIHVPQVLQPYMQKKIIYPV